MKSFKTKDGHLVMIDKINMIKCEQDGYSIFMNSCHIFIDKDDYNKLVEIIKNEK